MQSSEEVRVRDQRRVLVSALEEVNAPVALVTYTAPGENYHRVDARSATWQRWWNRSLAKRRKRLDNAIRGRLKRSGITPPVVLAWVVQRQGRGLDHMHVIFLCATDQHRRAIAAYVDQYRALTEHDWHHYHGRRYCFGFIDDPFRKRSNGHSMVFLEATRLGHYLAGYLLESAQLTRRMAADDKSGRTMWVSPTLLRQSGVTMLRCRRVRHAWHVTKAIDQGSRPRLPKWWPEIGERMAVLRMLRTVNVPGT